MEKPYKNFGGIHRWLPFRICRYDKYSIVGQRQVNDAGEASTKMKRIWEFACGLSRFKLSRRFWCLRFASHDIRDWFNYLPIWDDIHPRYSASNAWWQPPNYVSSSLLLCVRAWSIWSFDTDTADTDAVCSLLTICLVFFFFISFLANCRLTGSSSSMNEPTTMTTPPNHDILFRLFTMFV